MDEHLFCESTDDCQCMKLFPKKPSNTKNVTQNKDCYNSSKTKVAHCSTTKNVQVGTVKTPSSAQNRVTSLTNNYGVNHLFCESKDDCYCMKLPNTGRGHLFTQSVSVSDRNVHQKVGIPQSRILQTFDDDSIDMASQFSSYTDSSSSVSSELFEDDFKLPLQFCPSMESFSTESSESDSISSLSEVNDQYCVKHHESEHDDVMKSQWPYVDDEEDEIQSDTTNILPVDTAPGVTNYVPPIGLEDDEILPFQLPCVNVPCHNFTGDGNEHNQHHGGSSLSEGNAPGLSYYVPPLGLDDDDILPVQVPCKDENFSHSKATEEQTLSTHLGRQNTLYVPTVSCVSGYLPPLGLEHDEILPLQSRSMNGTQKVTTEPNNVNQSNRTNKVLETHLSSYVPPEGLEDDEILTVQSSKVDQQSSFETMISESTQRTDADCLNPIARLHIQDQIVTCLGNVSKVKWHELDQVKEMRDLKLLVELLNRQHRENHSTLEENIIADSKLPSDEMEKSEAVKFRDIKLEIKLVLSGTKTACTADSRQEKRRILRALKKYNRQKLQAKRALTRLLGEGKLDDTGPQALPFSDVCKYVLCKMKKYDRDPGKKATAVEMLYY